MKKQVFIKVLIIIAMVALVVLTGVYIYFEFSKNYNGQGQAPITDAILFYRQYPQAGEDNMYKEITLEQSLEVIKEKTAIVLYGFPSCKWCQEYVGILTEIAKEQEVEEILYVDIKEDRQNNTEAYKELVELTKEYLEVDMEDNKRVYVPDVYFVKDGKILGHNNETSTLSGVEVSDYYTEKVRSDLKQTLKQNIIKVYDNTCDDRNIGC